MAVSVSLSSSTSSSRAALAAVPWSRIRLAVFDVDGTLYDQRPLHRRMQLALAAHCATRPWDLPLLRTLLTFRRLREELTEEAGEGVSRLQYERPAVLLGLSPDAIRLAVETWLHERPLPHLRRCRFPGVEEVFRALKASGRTTAVFSDYPAEAKLRALELEADFHVAGLKPHPRGLERALERAGVGPEECVFIGDRDERDGECARRLGVHYLLKTSASTGKPLEFHRYEELLPFLTS